jgi:hypothetical protein
MIALGRLRKEGAEAILVDMGRARSIPAYK